MQITQGLRRALQVNSDGLATICGERQQNWKQFAERVARMAGALRALGLEDGDRVAILALNSDRYLEYYFFTPWAGAAVVPLNTRWAGPEVLFALNDSESRLLFVDSAYAALYEAIRPGIESIEAVIFIDDGAVPEGMLGYEDLLAAAAAAPDRDRRGDDLAGIYYTGGTTGRSKGVMLSQRNIFFNAVNAVATFGYDRDTHWLHAAPMFHLADGGTAIAVTMMGARHSFIPAFEPEAAFRIIQKDRVNFCLFVPTMLNLMLQHPAIDNYDLTSVERVTYGASPMPEAVLRQAMAKLSSWQFIQGYGMTELSPLATYLPWRDHVLEGPLSRQLKSCGLPTIGCEVRVVNEDGLDTALDEIGEIIVRGDNVMLGYWKQPEATAEVLKDGWMSTGDAATMDENGFIYIVDRVKDMIISGGENVYSAEVEQAVYQHPAVADCAVIGVPDERWGERVHAIVVPVEGAGVSEQDIIEHCHGLIGGYKCPRSVEFRNDPLPLSGAGKILKTELRKPYWAHAERNVG